MKKLIAIALCALCLVSLAACGSKEAETGEGSAELGMVNPFVTYDTMERSNIVQPRSVRAKHE